MIIFFAHFPFSLLFYGNSASTPLGYMTNVKFQLSRINRQPPSTNVVANVSNFVTTFSFYFFIRLVTLAFLFSVPPAKSFSERANEEHAVVERGAALTKRSGNARSRDACPEDKKMKNKSNKRKQVDSDQHGNSENEPPQKKPSTSVSVKMPGKAVGKAASKKKLIAGQGKLTSFFRV